ncbi:MAG: M1 family metallopeptidase, partial [Flavobacteriales bacterium]
MPCFPKPTSRSAARWAALLIAALPAIAGAQHSCQERKRAANVPAKGGNAAIWPWDLLHHAITLDLTQGSIIRASCAITATPRGESLSALPLQLEGLTVDSVVMDGQQLAFTHAGMDLEIALPQAYGPADTITLTVHYGGDPITDPSGFGGFYTTSAYSYNLGVAFQSVPHSYGRVWFPCADNFTERSTFEFIVTTNAPWNAWCNGTLLAQWQPTPGTIARHWRLQGSIPSYLASVAAANYAVVRDTLTSISGAAVPVTLTARPQDTTAMKNSFVNLPAAFSLFESRFGAHRWERVGYVLTPQGAMEHVTSIHYPQSIANGTLTYQAVMAHELAHHWFGDLVTCESAEQMWLNEGFAEYLSYLFIEEVNGPDAYMANVRANHRAMLQRAHIDDQGWWALNAVPQQWTYGKHVYNKGADVLHTLRSYMGYDAFGQGLASFIDAHAHEPVSVELLRDHLEQATGIPLQDFFSDWVMQPGWAAFEVEGMDVQPQQADGTFPTAVIVQQK